MSVLPFIRYHSLDAVGFCEVCGGDRRNGSLTTECPMVRMDHDRERDVACGRADYSDGDWAFAEPLSSDEPVVPARAGSYCPRHRNVMAWRHPDGDRCPICGEFFDGRAAPAAEPPEVRTFAVYRKLAERTDDPNMPLEYFIGSLCGESGELWEKIKKVVFHKHELTTTLRLKIREEFGDVLWYLDRAAVRLGFSLEEIAAENNAKLLRRYPDGFDAQRSASRPAE